jgi:hypothetical protein
MGKPTADEQYLEDIQLLNDRRVHITMMRDANGKPYTPSRETIHALAEVVRCLDSERQSARAIKFGSSEHNGT